VDLDQSLAVTLAEPHGRRSQQFEHCASLAKLQARYGTLICYRELIAIPQPDHYARIADALHDPADHGMIKIALDKALAGIETHILHLFCERLSETLTLFTDADNAGLPKFL
jgi:hypothetical protein